MEKIPITVLMTVWNGMPYLREAVESILRQTEKNFSFLILNNGSEDGSAAYLDGLSDPRLRIVRLPGNIGRSAALNMGLALVETPYVAVLDADDIAEPARLERQRAFLDAHPEVALLGSDIIYINVAGARIGQERFPNTHGQLRDSMPLMNQFAHAACMYRAAAAREAGGYPAKLPYAQDMGLWLAMMTQGHTTASLGEFLARIRLHPGQATRSLQLLLLRRADDHRLCERLLAVPGLSSAARQAACLRSAAALSGLGHTKMALDRLWKGICVNPLLVPVNPLLWRRLARTARRRLFPMPL